MSDKRLSLRAMREMGIADAPDKRAVDRKHELERQTDVAAAVHDATHDAKGNPAPLGMVLIEGKP